MDEKCYYDIRFAELAYAYMLRKKIKLNTGNLFWIMEKICKRVDLMNKNTKEKKISFRKGYCEVER